MSLLIYQAHCYNSFDIYLRHLFIISGYDEKYLFTTNDRSGARADLAVVVGGMFCTASFRIVINGHPRFHIVPHHGCKPNACTRDGDA